MTEPSTVAQVEATVAPNGDVVVPAAALEHLALAPGQRVGVRVVAPVRRRSMEGLLAGRLPDLSPEALAAARAEVWRGFAEEPEG